LPVGALQNFQVILSSSGERFRTQPFTNAQGLFLLPAVPGEYTVTVAPLRLGYYLKSMTYGDVDLTRNPLTLETDRADTDIRIVLTKTRPADTPPGVKVSGRITDWKVGRATLPLMVLNPAGTFEVADVSPKDDGSFEIDDVPPGEYAIRLGFARSRLFEVRGADVTDLSLTINDVGLPSSPIPMTGSGRYISGEVEAGNGTIPQFEVRFTAVRPGAGSGAPHVVPVSGRDFSLILPEGEYRVTVSGLPQDYALKSVTAGPLDLTEPFLIIHKGIADRISGAAIRPERITIRLDAP
jgi:hypothetical protein